MASDFKLRKCVSNEHKLVDQISQLPNDILVYILGFLTLEDAVRTSVLSKRWIDLWMYVVVLNFDPAKILEGIEETMDPINNACRDRSKYVKWVNKVLLSHKAIDLDAFRIRFYLDKSSKNDIDKWLKYAYARRVHRLVLDLLPYGLPCGFDTRDSYDFPPDLLGLNDRNSSAVCSSHSCRGGIDSDALFCFKSLRALTVCNVNVSGSVLEFFLNNCPLLEHLVVVSSGSLKELKVCGPSLVLKHLEILFCRELLSVTVCDTNIVSLKVTSGEESVVLKNVPKLVDVFYAGAHPQLYFNNAFSWLSCCLSTLEILTLNINSMDIEHGRSTAVAVPQLPKLKRLTFVQTFAINASLSSFTSIIRASPNLEKFALKAIRSPIEDDTGYYSPFLGNCGWTAMLLLASPLQHLKDVEIHGYCGHEKREVELVKYLVDNGVALERITIDPRNQPYHTLVEGRPMEFIYPLDKDEEIYRNLAKQQLEELVPSHIELVIL